MRLRWWNMFSPPCDACRTRWIFTVRPYGGDRGRGNVGRRLQARLEALGIKTLLAIRLAPTVGMRVISARWMSSPARGYSDFPYATL